MSSCEAKLVKKFVQEVSCSPLTSFCKLSELPGYVRPRSDRQREKRSSAFVTGARKPEADEEEEEGVGSVGNGKALPGMPADFSEEEVAIASERKDKDCSPRRVRRFHSLLPQIDVTIYETIVARRVRSRWACVHDPGTHCSLAHTHVLFFSRRRRRATTSALCSSP